MAIGGCAGITMSSVTGQAQGRLPCSAAKSAPEKAAITPGMARAADRSTEVIRACAIGLRAKAMCSMPGRTMLSVQFVCAGDQPGVLLAETGPAEFGLGCLGIRGHEVAPASAARRTARTMFSYPVHRQRLPSSPSRISWSLGRGLVRSRSAAAMIIPGVQ